MKNMYKLIAFLLIITLTNCSDSNQTGKMVKVFKGHSETILGIAQSPNGKNILLQV